MSRFLERANTDVKMKPQASSYLEPPWRGARAEAAARSEPQLTGCYNAKDGAKTPKTARIRMLFSAAEFIQSHRLHPFTFCFPRATGNWIHSAD